MEVKTILGDAVVNIFLIGHGVEHFGHKWEGGRLVSYMARAVSNVYGLEIRLKPEPANRGGKVLWQGTAETRLGVRPELPPEATIFLNALRPQAVGREYRPRTRKVTD